MSVISLKSARLKNRKEDNASLTGDQSLHKSHRSMGPESKKNCS